MTTRPEILPRRPERPMTAKPRLVYDELDVAWDELTAPGAPFEIEEVEVDGRRLRGFRHALSDIGALWRSTAAFADRDYLVYRDERITYGEAHARVAAIANWLIAAGVKTGDRVGIAMRNYPEWMLIYWACVSTGVAVVGMNAWWVADEFDFALADSSGCRMRRRSSSSRCGPPPRRA